MPPTHFLPTDPNSISNSHTTHYTKKVENNPYAQPINSSVIDSAPHRLVARETAASSVILVKNENDLLPLPKSTKVTQTITHSLTHSHLYSHVNLLTQLHSPQS